MSTPKIDLDRFLDDIPRGESGRYEFQSTVSGETLPAVPREVWTIGRRYSEVRLSRRLTLLQWAERDRLLSGDYVFDHRLNTWVCARELGELKAFFRRKTAQKVFRVTWLLLAIAGASLVAAPIPAALFGAAAAVLLILRYRIERSLP